MKKVGVISMYYNSHNYGALLQARALVECIGGLGYDCEQISYDKTDERYPLMKTKLEKLKDGGILSLFKLANNKVKYLVKAKYNQINETKINGLLKKRYELMKKYELETPHSSIIYNKFNATK